MTQQLCFWYKSLTDRQTVAVSDDDCKRLILTGKDEALCSLSTPTFNAAVQQLLHTSQITLELVAEKSAARQQDTLLPNLPTISDSFFRDLPSILPSAAEVVLLSGTLLGYVLTDFDFATGDEITTPRATALTAWLEKYRLVLSAIKAGADWPAGVPSGETFPHLLPWAAGGGYSAPPYTAIATHWSRYARWSIRHPSAAPQQAGPPATGATLPLAGVMTGSADDIFGWACPAPPQQADEYQAWWDTTQDALASTMMPVYAWAEFVQGGGWRDPPPGVPEVAMHRLPALVQFILDRKPVFGSSAAVSPAPERRVLHSVPLAKAADMPRYSGSNVTVQQAFSWLSNLELHMLYKQVPESQKVLYACLHLDGAAATWRDQTLAVPADGQLTSLSDIIYADFKASFLQRFVPYNLRVQSANEFKDMKQTGSVQEYSALFRARHSALLCMPEVGIKDEWECAGIYLRGLKPHIRRGVQSRADVEDENTSALSSLWLSRLIRSACQCQRSLCLLHMRLNLALTSALSLRPATVSALTLSSVRSQLASVVVRPVTLVAALPNRLAGSPSAPPWWATPRPTLSMAMPTLTGSMPRPCVPLASGGAGASAAATTGTTGTAWPKHSGTTPRRAPCGLSKDALIW